MRAIHSIWLAVGLAVAATGCQPATRGWEEATLSTRDREAAFEAARNVLGRRFEIADANWAHGRIRTRPCLVQRDRAGTLADVRGAGGRWRQTATCEIGRGGLEVVVRVAVLLEREGTTAAVVMTRTGRDEGTNEAPASAPPVAGPGWAGKDVWVEVGYDRELAKELLSGIADEVRRLQEEEPSSEDSSPKDVAEESRRIGEEQGF